MSEKKKLHTKMYRIYANLPGNATVRLLHRRGGDSQGQETRNSAEKETRNYDTECSNHYPSQSPPKALD